MSSVEQFSWEDIAAPDFEHPARKAWREAVAEIAEKAKATLPECTAVWTAPSRLCWQVMSSC